MNLAEIKLSLFQKIDSLEKNKLKEIYGILVNYINGNRDIEEEWNVLSEEQKDGIFDAIEEIDSGKTISHDNIISKFRDKYKNAGI